MKMQHRPNNKQSSPTMNSTTTLPRRNDNGGFIKCSRRWDGHHKQKNRPIETDHMDPTQQQAKSPEISPSRRRQRRRGRGWWDDLDEDPEKGGVIGDVEDDQDSTGTSDSTTYNNNTSAGPAAAEMVTTAVVVELTDRELQRNRTFMTIVHFVLTYPRWSFSLFLLLATSSGSRTTGNGGGVVLPTPREALQRPLETLRAVVSLESRAYLECAVHVLDESAQDRLNHTAETEWQESLDKRRHNLGQLQTRAAAMVQSCTRTTHHAQRALNQYLHQQQRQQQKSRNKNVSHASVPWIYHYANESSHPLGNRSSNSNSSNQGGRTRCTVQDRQILVGRSDNASNDHGSVDSSIYNKEQEEVKVTSWTNQIGEELSAWRLRTLDMATRLGDYAQNRSTYDYNYFVGIKLTKALELLQDWNVKVTQLQLVPSSWNGLLEKKLLEQLRTLLQGGILDVLDEARARIGILETRLQSFYVSIDSFRVEYQQLFHRLQLSLAFVKDFVPPRIKLPSYMDFSTIPRVHTLLPSPVFAMPQFASPYLPEVNLEPILTTMLQLIQAAVREVVIHDMSQTFETLLQELLEGLQALLVLEDYDPPQYTTHSGVGSDIDHDLWTLDKSNQEAQERINQLLEDSIEASRNATYWEEQILQATRGGSGGGDGGAAATLDSAAEAASNLELDETTASSASGFPNGFDGGNATSFAYLEPTFPTFTVPEVLELCFLLLFTHQWIIEIVIQFFRIVRLKQKYERNATPDLPEIDLVSEGDEKDDDEDSHNYYNESSWPLIRLALLEHLFLTPWMIVGIMLLPIALLGVFWWFPHVKQSCMDTRNGTFLARNMIAPILINKASLAGNAHYTTAEFQCRRLQRHQCALRFHESDQMYRSDLMKLHTLVAEYNETIHERDRFHRCIDLDALDQSFSTACCGLEGYSNNRDDEGSSGGHMCKEPGIPAECPIDSSTIPRSPFQPIGQILGINTLYDGEQPACWPRKWWEDFLVDSRFDCTTLFQDDMCSSLSCTGVDSARIVEATIEADCQVEMYIVKCCVLLLLALYHGIMVNLISSLAFNGVKRVRWRNLKPDGIKFRTHVAESDGKLVKGDDPKERLDRIQTALRRFQRVGQVQLILSAMLFAAWFISFFVLRRQVLERIFVV